MQEEAPPPRPGVVRADDFDSTLYFLDEKEIAYLRDEVNREYAQDLRRNVLAMLFDVLELQPYPTVRAELISILDSFLPYLLGAGDFLAVAYVLREVKAMLQRARELLPEQRKALEDLPGRLSQPEALSQLLQSLDEAAAHPSPEELGELFGELRPEALPTLLAWVSRVSNQRLKVVLEQALQRLGSAHVPDLVGVHRGRRRRRGAGGGEARRPPPAEGGRPGDGAGAGPRGDGHPGGRRAGAERPGDAGRAAGARARARRRGPRRAPDGGAGADAAPATAGRWAS